MLSQRLTNHLTVVDIEDTTKLILAQQAVTHEVILKAWVIQSTQKRRNRELLVLANAHHDGFRRICFNLNPRTLGWNQGCRELPVQGEVQLITEVNTWGTGKLGHNDTLGAVDNKRTLFRHQWKVAQINLGLLNFTVRGCQTDTHLDRRLECDITAATLLKRVLGLPKGEVNQLNSDSTCVIVNRRERLEQFLQSLLKKPTKRIQLKLNEVGNAGRMLRALCRMLNLHTSLNPSQVGHIYHLTMQLIDVRHQVVLGCRNPIPTPTTTAVSRVTLLSEVTGIPAMTQCGTNPQNIITSARRQG